MLKKLAFILIGLIIILLASAVVIPIIFKDDILAFVKKEANKSLNAEVDFGDLELSLFSSFPDLYFELNDIRVNNKSPFDGMTLAEIKNLNLTVDLMSVINGEQIEIVGINIIQPNIDVKVLEDGTANWDIAKPSEEVEEEIKETDDAPAQFEIGLKQFTIQEANINYDDASMNLSTSINNLNYDLKGDFTQSVFEIENLLAIDAISLDFDGIKYLKEVNTSFDAKMKIDLDSSKYTFEENEFVMNALKLKFGGWVLMPEEDIAMDVNFETNSPTFAEILSLVPGVYTADFANIESKGQLGIAGYAKGVFNDNSYPAFGLNMFIEDAMVKYPDVPSAINDIQLTLLVNNPDGELDHTIVEMPKLHFKMGQEPFDMKLFSKTPISDPYIDFMAKGKVDLKRLQEAMPLEELEGLSGLITTNLEAKGNYSTIEQERYEDFKLSGDLGIQNMHYNSKDIGQPVDIVNMLMSFNPKNVTLRNLNMKLGSSDLQMNGSLNNFVAYALADSTLKGSLNMTSTLFNANEWLEESETTEETSNAESTTEDTSSLEVFEVPAGIDFVMNTSMNKILYDNMEITNAKGNLVVKNEKVVMNGVGMKILGGNVLMSGFYSTQTPAEKKNPSFDFDMELLNMDIQKSATTFNTVEKFAPVAKSSEGMFSTKLNIKGNLDNEMMPLYDQITGKGTMQVVDMIIKGFPLTDKIGDKLNYEDIKRFKSDNVNISYEIKDGRIFFDPFKFKAGQMNMEVVGSNGIDETMDYTINTSVPRDKLGSEANQAVSGLLSSIKGGDKIKIGETVDLDIKVGGTVTDPTISLGVKDMANNIKDDIKDQVKEKVDEVKNKVKDEAAKKKAEAEAKARAEAQAKADKIIKDAEAQAAKVRAQGKSTADQIRKEGEANAQKLIKEAGSNPLKKKAAEIAADKLRKEANDKANKTEQEANKQANNIVSTAKQKADALLK